MNKTDVHITTAADVPPVDEVDVSITLITTTPSEVSHVNKTDVRITTTADVPPVDEVDVSITLMTPTLHDNSLEVTK